MPMTKFYRKGCIAVSFKEENHCKLFLEKTAMKAAALYFTHSSRKVCTGLILAAFTACMPTVKKAMIMAITPARKKYQGSKSTLKAKLSSQFFVSQ